MEQYGDFTSIVGCLTNNLGEVRSVWNDQTALTYYHINENMEHFSIQIWNYRNNSLAGYNMVKARYNEDEFEDVLNRLNSKIASV